MVTPQPWLSSGWQNLFHVACKKDGFNRVQEGLKWLIVVDSCAKNAGRHQNIVNGSLKLSSPVIHAHPYL
jgi:hypothetical protein